MIKKDTTVLCGRFEPAAADKETEREADTFLGNNQTKAHFGLRTQGETREPEALKAGL